MKRLSIAAAVAAALFASATSAEVITINNPSFEAPALGDGATTPGVVQGWTLTRNTAAGIWKPKADDVGVTEGFLDGITGSQVAYSNGANIRQDLVNEKVGYGYLYTLKVDVGGRDADWLGGTLANEPFGILLRRGIEGEPFLLQTLGGVFGRNLPGNWVEQTVKFEAIDPNPEVADQKLVVVLANNGTVDSDATTDGIQLNFDNVRLSRAKLVSCEGFFPPFAEPLSLRSNNRRAIPVKMRLYDYYGNELTDADFAYPPLAVVDFEAGDNGDGGESDVALSGLSDDGTDFRYDPNEGQWILNLAARQYRTAGTWTVSVVSGDPDFAISSLGSCSQYFIRQ